jgi:putative glutamine amidotransferase
MRRPTIGITSNFGSDKAETPRLQHYLMTAYIDAVFAAGGLPVALPVPASHDGRLLDELLDRCDGLIFTGGLDVPPEAYGAPLHVKTHPLHERRARFELDFFRHADQRRKPIFAVCLGHQVAHVCRGGKLIQHVDDLDVKPAIAHYRAKDLNAFHRVRFEPDSRLAAVLGTTNLETNSRHHQAVDPAHQGAGLRAVAHTADGLVEGSEDMNGRYLLSVQWHPEDLADRPEHLALFAALVAEAGRTPA